MLTARIVLEYPSVSFARCVMRALEPDNFLNSARMQITVRVKGKKLYLTICQCPTVETMQATLEDVFRCVTVAKESMSLAKTTAKDYRKIKK
jgi:tRNA threonylcarbamoyladenosine modification (KEOPS) complex  Pcc1 subunit